MRFVPRTLAFALLPLLAAPAAAKERPGFETAGFKALEGVPVHVVTTTPTLRVQLPWLHTPAYPMQRNVVHRRMHLSGYDPEIFDVHRRGFPLSPSPEGPLIARQMVQPGIEVLTKAGCFVSDGGAIARAVETAIRGTVWGANATFSSHAPLQPRQGEGEPHYEFEVGYSMAPDFSAVVTVVRARLYKPGLRLVPGDWKYNAQWLDEIVVVSDRIDVPQKTWEEIDATKARENARYAENNPKARAKRAQGGDSQAIEDNANGIRWHKQRLEEAGSVVWSLLDGTLPRAQRWTQDNCAPLHAAVKANADEAGRVLGQLFAGKTNKLPPEWFPSNIPAFDNAADQRTGESDPTRRTERRLYADAENVVVSRRAGDNVVVDFRYSWAY